MLDRASEHDLVVMWKPAVVALTASLLLACSSEAEAPNPIPKPPASAGVYSEIDDFGTVEAVLDLLEAHDLELYQVVSRDHFRSPSLASLIEACAARGITMRAWIVVSMEDGYWPGESNAAVFGEAVDEFMAWVDEDQLPIEWITFDMEPAWDYTEALRQITADLDNPNRTEDLLTLIQEHHDPIAYQQALADYQALVGRVHAAGLKAHAVTYPLVIDDLPDGDSDIQDGLDIPVDGVDWDELTFMMYRSVMQGFSAAPLTERFFYVYAVDAAAAYGQRAGFDFGLVGTGLVTLEGSYTDPAQLRSDVAAARAGGIDRLHLYSFEGARAEADPHVWLDFATPPAELPPDDGSDPTVMRTLFMLLDDILGAE